MLNVDTINCLSTSSSSFFANKVVNQLSFMIGKQASFTLIRLNKCKLCLKYCLIRQLIEFANHDLSNHPNIATFSQVTLFSFLSTKILSKIGQFDCLILFSPLKQQPLIKVHLLVEKKK